jgi:hypothetical protein
MPTTIELASPWLKGRTFASWREESDRRVTLSSIVFFSPSHVADVRAALAPNGASNNPGGSNTQK